MRKRSTAWPPWQKCRFVVLSDLFSPRQITASPAVWPPLEMPKRKAQVERAEEEGQAARVTVATEAVQAMAAVLRECSKYESFVRVMPCDIRHVNLGVFAFCVVIHECGMIRWPESWDVLQPLRRCASRASRPTCRAERRRSVPRPCLLARRGTVEASVAPG